GMRQHLMAVLRDGAHRRGRALSNDCIHHHAGFGAISPKSIHQTVNADLDAISGPRDRHRVEHAGWKRIAHRADARRLAVRPSFETDIEHDSNTLAAGPYPIRPFLHLRLRRSGKIVSYALTLNAAIAAMLTSCASFAESGTICTERSRPTSMGPITVAPPSSISILVEIEAE